MYLESKPSDSSREISKSLYCECRVRESFVVGRSVGLCLCSHVFSRTVAAVDIKRGYVGMCKGRYNIITRGLCTFQVLFIVIRIYSSGIVINSLNMILIFSLV